MEGYNLFVAWQSLDGKVSPSGSFREGQISVTEVGGYKSEIYTQAL